MQKISVSSELFKKVLGLELSCIQCQVAVFPSNEGLIGEISQKIKEVAGNIKTEEISSLPAIKASREAYRACGKDPARYRLSAEALLRRVTKGIDLYYINNIVDLLNLVSFSTGFSIGGYDAEKINGPVEFGIGYNTEPYIGIGRGELNIENLPAFRDLTGPFGTPTSDSERTMVTESTTIFLMVIIGFGNNTTLPQATGLAIELLKKYASAQNIETQMIK